MATQSRTQEISAAVPYTLHVRRTGADGQLIERVLTSEEIDRLTPRGEPITASFAEIFAVLQQVAKNIRPQPSPVSEAAGAVIVTMGK